MPKYKNSTNARISAEGQEFPPQTVTSTYHWLRTLPSGLTLVENTPTYNPVLSSTLYAGASGTADITLPADTDDYSVRIRCYGGSISVAFNGSGATPVVILVSDETVEFMVRNRCIGTMTITYLESSTKAKVDVFLPATMTWVK